MISPIQKMEKYHGIPFFTRDIRNTLNEVFEESTVYILIESPANDKIVYEIMRKYDDIDIFPIYAGTDFEPLLRISPWLIELHREHGLLEWFITEGPNRNSGIFIASDKPKVEIIKHLQWLLEVRLENYNTAAFRFYDPRVLHRFALVSDQTLFLQFLGIISFCAWGLNLNIRNNKHEWYCVLQDKGKLQNSPHLPLLFTDDTIKAFEDAHNLWVADRLETLLGKG